MRVLTSVGRGGVRGVQRDIRRRCAESRSMIPPSPSPSTGAYLLAGNGSDVPCPWLSIPGRAVR
jgi:hypothetical protein